MKIMPLNNAQQNTQFKAKFSKQDVNHFLKEIEDCDVDIIPQLYTMLDFIKKAPGEQAKIKSLGLWCQILIDGKSINGENKYFNAFHALMNATVRTKTTLLKNDIYIKRMSEEEFENAYYSNNKKTIQDIENIFEA